MSLLCEYSYSPTAETQNEWASYVFVLFCFNRWSEIYQINGPDANMVMFLWHILAFLLLFFLPIALLLFSMSMSSIQRDLISTGLVYMPFFPISRNTSDQGMLQRHWYIIEIPLPFSQSSLTHLFSLICILLFSNVKKHYFYGHCMKGELISVSFWLYLIFSPSQNNYWLSDIQISFLPSYLYFPL